MNYQSLGVKLTGSTTTVPDNELAKLMYYLDCVFAVIQYDGAEKYANYREYYSLTSEEEQIVKVENSMTKKVVIDGMMCTHCSGRVEKALNAVPGASASVDLESKTATVSGDVTDEAIINAVTEAGYTVLEIK